MREKVLRDATRSMTVRKGGECGVKREVALQTFRQGLAPEIYFLEDVGPVN